MAYYRPEDEEVVVVERNTSGSGVAINLLWVIATLAIAGMIVYTIFFSDLFRHSNIPKKTAVDINVTAPVNR